jgi:DHA1 family multidrug resistance protein-like MFS transporter
MARLTFRRPPPTTGNDATATGMFEAPSNLDEVPTTVPADDPENPDAPPIRWRLNLYAIVLAEGLAIIGFSMRSPFLPFYLGDLGVTTDAGQALWAGWINAIGSATMAITAPFWGIIADRRGRRPMLLRALFAAMFTVGLMGVVTSPWHLLALRAIEGAFTGTVTAATALVATTTPKARLGFGLGLVQTAIFTGSALGPPPGGFLADLVGPRFTFAVAGACLGLAGLIVLFVVRERFVPMSGGRSANVDTGRWARLLPASGLLLGSTMLALVAVLFSVRLAGMAIQPIMPLFVEQILATSTNAASRTGLLLGIGGVTGAISALVLGNRGDRIGHRRILLACAIAAGLLYLAMATVNAYWELLILQAFYGAAAGGLAPSANALIAHFTPPERRGAMFGMTTSVASVGAFIGPLAGPALAVVFGFRATFVATGLLLVILAITIARGRFTGDPAA